MVTSRIWFTSEQKAELWDRWKQGQSISSISRALERRNKGGVQRIVSLHGGIAPSARRRAASALELGEREEISRGIAAGLAIRVIARVWGDPHQRYVGRSLAMAVHKRIVQLGPKSRLGSERFDRSSVAWHALGGYGGGWRKSWRCNGRRSR
jgi:hypothetical protein